MYVIQGFLFIVRTNKNMVNVCGRKIIFWNDVKNKDIFSSNIIRYFLESFIKFHEFSIATLF